MLQDPGLTWADTQRVEYYWIDRIRDRRGIRLLLQISTAGIFAYHSSVGSKELDECHMARNRSESDISRN